MKSQQSTSALTSGQILPENGEAFILRVGTGRFVIVRTDETDRLYPVVRQRICDLRPGDEVIYRGKAETIQAIDLYR